MKRTLLGSLMAAAVSALALAGSGVARADDAEAPPGSVEDVPALSEYIESIPTAAGEKPSGPKANGKPRPVRSRPSAPAVERQIAKQPPAVARKLRKIVRSSEYGAPVRPAPKQSQSHARMTLHNEPDAVRSPGTDAIGTAITFAATGGDSRLTVLLVVVLLSTFAAAALTALRTLQRRPRV